MRERYDELLLLGEKAVGADEFERAAVFFEEAEGVARQLDDVDLADRAFCNRCSVLVELDLSLIHISEPTRPAPLSRMPSSA